MLLAWGIIAEAKICLQYDKGIDLFNLPTVVNESSGLAISKLYKNRFYHINDKGSDSAFYYSSSIFPGEIYQKVWVKGANFRDTEDLGLGTCGTMQQSSCLFIADIGDNKLKRKQIEITIVDEKTIYNKSLKAKNSHDDYMVDPLKILNLSYPDGIPRNSESFAVHPNGDLYLITKPGKKSPIAPLEVFKVAFKQWANTTSTKLIMMQKLGELDLRILNPHEGKREQLLTGMDIAADGLKFIGISYGPLFEFAMDLSKSKNLDTSLMRVGIDYTIHRLDVILGQEAISYGKLDQTIYYSNERKEGSSSVIRKLKCL